MIISTAQLRALSSSAAPWIIAGIVADQHFMVDAGIATPPRIRHFFAQTANETGGFARLEENLNYSAARLREVWPTRFRTAAAAAPYAHDPAKLAEKVYGGRLGNDKPGDGWTYHGSGLLMNTGKANFAEVEKETGLPVVANPELLRTFPGALQAACIYWGKRNINALADRDDIEAVTRAVNGGLIGLDDRKVWLSRAKTIWPGTATSAPAGDDRPVLKLGDEGDAVRRLQELLRAKGADIVVDGSFGSATDRAVRVFQDLSGLTADGVVGAKTWAKL